MKRLILFLLFLGALVAVAFGQDIDTVVVADKGGFWGFWDKYQEAILLVLATSGVSIFFWNKVRELRAAIDTLLTAGDDTSPEGRKVTQEEWNGIVKAFKAIWQEKPKE
jgi:hypothetical protein